MTNIAGRIVSATKLASDEIRLMVLRGELEPDRMVSIERLAELLGVSRTPVREAVQRLESEGLVEVIPRVGVRVRGLTTAEAADIYVLKGAVEPIAARWASERGSEAAAHRLAPLLTLMDRAAAAGDVPGYADVVEQFHFTLIELAGAPALTDMWRVVAARVHRLRHLNLQQPGRIDLSLDKHRRIAAAIVSGDGERAHDEMVSHLREARDAAVKAVAATPPS